MFGSCGRFSGASGEPMDELNAVSRLSLRNRTGIATKCDVKEEKWQHAKHCGNDYDKVFQVVMNGQAHTFDSFECGIHALAPTR
jgi:hypothetical protein